MFLTDSPIFVLYIQKLLIPFYFILVYNICIHTIVIQLMSCTFSKLGSFDLKKLLSNNKYWQYLTSSGFIILQYQFFLGWANVRVNKGNVSNVCLLFCFMIKFKYTIWQTTPVNPNILIIVQWSFVCDYFVIFLG